MAVHVAMDVVGARSARPWWGVADWVIMNVHAVGHLVCGLMAMPVPPDSQFVAGVGDGQCAGDATDAAAAFGVLPGR